MSLVRIQPVHLLKIQPARTHFEDIANATTFRTDPTLAWGFYGHRLALYRETLPHEGFGILRMIAARLRHGAFVHTSNVDGQFQKAGFSEARIMECHGSIHHLQCVNFCSDTVWPAAAVQPVIIEATCRLASPPPVCPACGGLARPNILMFYDSGWNCSRTEAQRRRREEWLKLTPNRVVIELGAGTAIPMVRVFGEQAGGPLIRINPREAQIQESLGVVLSMGALPGVRAIQRELIALGFFGASTDPLYGDAVEILPVIASAQGAYLDGPISLMQRTFRLGYVRARQLVDDLGEAGLLSDKDEQGGRWIADLITPSQSIATDDSVETGNAIP